MDVIFFTASVVVAFIVAWKAVDAMEPNHSGKAALFAMAAALLGPYLIAYGLQLLVDTSDEPMMAEQMLSDVRFVFGSKIAFAFSAVLVWCGGETLLQA